jgi:O-methyltransferase
VGEENFLRGTFRDWLAHNSLGRALRSLTSAIEIRLLAHYKQYGDGPLVVRTLRRIWATNRDILFSPSELWMIRELAAAQSHHGGCFAEVGVFRGVSAEVICQAKDPATEIYLFDTFEGLPPPGNLDARFKESMFSASEEAVCARLQPYSKWRIFKGLFPGTAMAVANSSFSFVHLDVDLYESTLAGLEFFWPRLLKGGVLVSHDFSHCKGVHGAFREFFQHRMDYRLIELPTTQAMVIKD